MPYYKGQFYTNAPNGVGTLGGRRVIWSEGQFIRDPLPNAKFTPGSAALAAAGASTAAAAAGEVAVISGLVGVTALAGYVGGSVFYDQAAVPGTWANNLASAIVDNPLAKGYMGLAEFAKGFIGLPGQPKGGKVLQPAVFPPLESRTGKVAGAEYKLLSTHVYGDGSTYYGGPFYIGKGPISAVTIYQGNPASVSYVGQDGQIHWLGLVHGGSTCTGVSIIRSDGTSKEADAEQGDPNATPVVPEIKIESGTNPVSPYGPVDSRTPPIPTDNPHSSQPQPPSNVDPAIQWPGLQPNPNPLATDSTWASVGKEVWEGEGKITADRIRLDPNYRQTTKGGPPQLIPSPTQKTGAITKANAPATVVEPGNGQPAQLPTPNKSPQPGQTPTHNKSPGSGNASNPQPGQTPTPSGQTPTPSSNRQIVPTLTPSKTPNPSGTPAQEPTPTPVNVGRATRYNPVNQPTPDPFPEFDWKTGTYKVVTKDPTPTPTPTDNKFPKFDWVNGKFVDPITTPEPATKPSTPFIPGFPPVIPPAIVDEKKVSPIDPKTGKPPQPTPEPNKGTQTPPTTGGGSGGGTCMYPGYHGQVMSGHTATQAEVGAVNTLINTETNVAVRAVGDNVTAVKNAIGTPIGEGVSTIFQGINKIQEWGTQFSQSLYLDRIYNGLSLLLQVHNAAMLSRSLVDSISFLIDSGMQILHLKNENDQALDISGILGKSVENFIKGIVGETTYNGLNANWKKLSAIYTSAVNIYQLTLSNMAGIAEGLETIGSYTGRIGNALKKGGVILENSYNWMDENVKIKTGRFAAIQKVTDGLESAENITSNLTEVTETVQETTESITQIQTEFSSIKTAINDKETAKTTTENTNKTASQTPTITKPDMLNPNQ